MNCQYPQSGDLVDEVIESAYRQDKRCSEYIREIKSRRRLHS